MKEIDAITADVLDVALRLHREPGPGLPESVYETLKEGFRRIVNDCRPSAPSPSSPRLRVNDPSFGA